MSLLDLIDLGSIDVHVDYFAVFRKLLNLPSYLNVCITLNGWEIKLSIFWIDVIHRARFSVGLVSLNHILHLNPLFRGTGFIE